MQANRLFSLVSAAIERGDDEKTLTNERNDVDLLAVLVAEAAGDPVPVPANIRDRSNPSEHVATSHDEDDYDGGECPGPASEDDGGDKPEEGTDTNDRDCCCEPLCPVNGVLVRNRNGGEFGEVLGKRGGVEATGIEILEQL